MRIRRSVRIIGVLAATVLMLAQATMVDASTPVAAGSKLTTSVQPQNFDRSCDGNVASPNPNCTWMFRHVYNRSGGQKAPKDGYIDKVRLIACAYPAASTSSSARSGRGRTIRASTRPRCARPARRSRSPGTLMDAATDTTTSRPSTSRTSTWNKGEDFGVRGTAAEALRCNSGSPNVLQFVPPLVNGSSYTNPDDTNGCDPLIELQYR